ncbi:unnamed protein product [Adineta steineri]|uniref:Protein kinase domain-containing protein n=1 Tax=Adineta steineri TaxID=433720 RepID=A0A813Q7E2_9BILA|nr:unnamed protein product [Adineta steineri]CAF1284190.1 unnamed protein product [Adineta steineri]
MKKENYPHMLNGHTIYVYRELRGIPNFKKIRAYRDIRALSFGAKAPHSIPESELKRHFAEYGTILNIETIENDIKITYDNYDSVDKAILDNPHMFNNISYIVEKYLGRTTTPIDECSPMSSATDLQSFAAPQHHKSEPALVNTKSAGSYIDSRHSTEVFYETVKLSSSDTGYSSQSSSTITVVNDRSIDNPSRILELAVKDVKEQANPDLPDDVPQDWTSKNMQSGEAGGQGEVRIVYYKNNLEQLGAIKIYSIAAKVKKDNEGLNAYYKERRMRAHRELTALKRLQGKSPSCLKPTDNWCIRFRGVIHRDIKPINLLVSYDRNTPIETAEIYVIDFGLAYIENREDDVDLSSFEENEDSMNTCLGHTIGNRFFRVPQLNSASTKQLTPKEKHVLLDVRRSPTIDASSICAILFWLITNIEPGLKIRDKDNLAPHQTDKARSRIINKIEEAANLSGIVKNLLPEFKKQLTNYLMSTFDKGFENAEYQWTIEQLQYRLESILHLLHPKTMPFDQQLSDATKRLVSFESATAVSNLFPIEFKFHNISLAYESAKAKFIAQHSSCSWYDGHCHWSEYQQNMTERKNHDLLSYQQKKKNWMLIIVCSVHLDDNGKIFTLAIGSNFNGVYVELPLGQYAPRELDSLNIDLEFERELINLLQIISNP